MSRLCLFPGTFDPPTRGHADLVERALALFDEVVIGIGVNTAKQPMFPLETRIAWCGRLFDGDDRVSVRAYEGLTVDFCRQIGAGFILRGIRFAGDLEYERSIADMNRRLNPSLETVFLTPSPEWSTLASSLVRDVLRYGGDPAPFVPEAILADLTRPGGTGTSD